MRGRKLLTTLAGFSTTALCLAPQLPYGRNTVVVITLALLAAGPVVFLFIIHYTAVRRRRLAGTSEGSEVAGGTESPHVGH